MKLSEEKKNELFEEKEKLERRLTEIKTMLIPLDDDSIGKCYHSKEYGHILVQDISHFTDYILVTGMTIENGKFGYRFNSEGNLMLTAKDFTRAKFKEESFEDFKIYMFDCVNEALVRTASEYNIKDNGNG